MRQVSTRTETVNAFVDGELKGAEAAVFLGELAGDAALARQVSDLTRLKAAVQDSFDELPCHAPDLQELFDQYDAGGDRTGDRTGGWRTAIRRGLTGAGLRLLAGAGAAVAAVVLAAIVFFWQADGVARDGFVAQAIDAHHRWLTRPLPSDAPEGRRQLAAFQRLNDRIYVPDLSASKLSIGLVTRFGDDGVQVGYVGTRACHLSLFIRPTDTPGTLAMSEAMVRDSRVFSWRENRLDYALLAVGMDKIRLRLIAEDVLQATRLMQPFDRATQMALRLNRQKSQPCAA